MVYHTLIDHKPVTPVEHSTAVQLTQCWFSDDVAEMTEPEVDPTEPEPFIPTVLQHAPDNVPSYVHEVEELYRKARYYTSHYLDAVAEEKMDLKMLETKMKKVEAWLDQVLDILTTHEGSYVLRNRAEAFAKKAMIHMRIYGNNEASAAFFRDALESVEPSKLNPETFYSPMLFQKNHDEWLFFYCQVRQDLLMENLDS